jgi:hypothetical protein
LGEQAEEQNGEVLRACGVHGDLVRKLRISLQNGETQAYGQRAHDLKGCEQTVEIDRAVEPPLGGLPRVTDDLAAVGFDVDVLVRCRIAKLPVDTGHLGIPALSQTAVEQPVNVVGWNYP